MLTDRAWRDFSFSWTTARPPGSYGDVRHTFVAGSKSARVVTVRSGGGPTSTLAELRVHWPSQLMSAAELSAPVLFIQFTMPPAGLFVEVAKCLNQEVGPKSLGKGSADLTRAWPAS